MSTSPLGTLRNSTDNLGTISTDNQVNTPGATQTNTVGQTVLQNTFPQPSMPPIFVNRTFTPPPGFEPNSTPVDPSSSQLDDFLKQLKQTILDNHDKYTQKLHQVDKDLQVRNEQYMQITKDLDEVQKNYQSEVQALTNVKEQYMQITQGLDEVQKNYQREVQALADVKDQIRQNALVLAENNTIMATYLNRLESITQGLHSRMVNEAND